MGTIADIDWDRPTGPEPLPTDAHLNLREMIQLYGAPAVIKALSEITFGDIRRMSADDQYRAIRYAGQLRTVAEGIFRDL